MGDKTGLLALKQHFKHVSITMTDRYVGRDLELLDLVASEKQQQLGHALDELIGADRLAGKLGEQIIARNERFRGRVGEEVRREYVRMVLEETDLVILPHEYGYCIYRAEVARCGASGRASASQPASAARTSPLDKLTTRSGSAAAPTAYVCLRRWSSYLDAQSPPRRFAT
jgi:hypothetical protein